MHIGLHINYYNHSQMLPAICWSVSFETS